MKVVVIASQKGGAGKTTLTINLAVEAERRKQSVAIVDIDPQASVTQWGDSRKIDAPVVMSVQATRLDHALDELAKAGADYVFVDTSPHAESAALAAIRRAGLVIVPCRPAILDLRAIGNTVELIKLAKCQNSVVLFNAVLPRSNILREAEEAVGSLGISACPFYITQRIAFSNSITMGLSVQEYEPMGKATQEIQEIFDWLIKNKNL